MSASTRASTESPRRAGGDAGRGTRPVAPVARDGAHGLLRRDAQGVVGSRRSRSATRRTFVPSTLVDERVWARVEGGGFVVVHGDSAGGPREAARHTLTTRGRPSIDAARYSQAGRRNGRKPRARSADEEAFLQIGPGAEAWLIAAAAAGATRIRRKLAEAVDLAKLHGAGQVDEALRAAADAGRFAEGDLHRDPRPPAARSSCSPRARVSSSRCSAQRAPGRAST
ncbi:MAG: hypothetical protein QOJ63_419 [Solirubrobacteraceae bacterium]|nr:hypothetical protein [Solirubrobacteraceae bacterium]